MLRYAELTNPLHQVRELTSLTLEEFTAIVPSFEAAFPAHMQDWTMTLSNSYNQGNGPGWR